MARRHEHGIELDACTTCGIWFDRGELEAHREQRARSANQRRAALRFEPGAGASPGACPRCSVALEPGRAAELALARCPSCQGVWVPVQRRAAATASSAWDWLDVVALPLEGLDVGERLFDLLDFLGGIDI
jgi:Zn-finger nucleic acid-binding protein